MESPNTVTAAAFRKAVKSGCKIVFAMLFAFLTLVLSLYIAKF